MKISLRGHQDFIVFQQPPFYAECLCFKTLAGAYASAVHKVLCITVTRTHTHTTFTNVLLSHKIICLLRLTTMTNCTYLSRLQMAQLTPSFIHLYPSCCTNTQLCRCFHPIPMSQNYPESPPYLSVTLLIIQALALAYAARGIQPQHTEASRTGPPHDAIPRGPKPVSASR
jgi:hypothetical protein